MWICKLINITFTYWSCESESKTLLPDGGWKCCSDTRTVSLPPPPAPPVAVALAPCTLTAPLIP